MFSTYVRVNLEAGNAPYDPGLPEAIQQLKGHGTALWLHVHGPRSPSNALDDRAVEVIRDIAEMARASELPVVLYPHVGFYVATTKDAVRLVDKVDRDNVGASFNLCHFLKQNDARDLNDCLKHAMPKLLLVSINGADSGDTRAMGWNRLIQTLDRGTFDVTPVLRTLKEGGYKGPIGLQCYAIPGDITENLGRSIKAWRKCQARLDDASDTAR
jgi:sugar phosphate isomerase/epimerase